MNISFIRYSPQNVPELTDQVVACYREVFADTPWHEWKQCPVCKKHWGIRDRQLLTDVDLMHCGQPVADFWTVEQVIADLNHEITTEASCWLARDGSKVIGFCLGYPMIVSKLEQKLGISLTAIPGTAVAYQDEVGVVAAYRGQKIAKQMVSTCEPVTKLRLRSLLIARISSRKRRID